MFGNPGNKKQAIRIPTDLAVSTVAVAAVLIEIDCIANM
jgi:hypothetical protein